MQDQADIAAYTETAIEHAAVALLWHDECL